MPKIYIIKLYAGEYEDAYTEIFPDGYWTREEAEEKVSELIKEDRENRDLEKQLREHMSKIVYPEHILEKDYPNRPICPWQGRHGYKPSSNDHKEWTKTLSDWKKQHDEVHKLRHDFQEEYKIAFLNGRSIKTLSWDSDFDLHVIEINLPERKESV